jgi:hypothetical protein
MDKFFENLKREAEANPLMAAGVAAGLLTAAGKFVEAAGSVQSKRAYAKIAKNAAKKAPKKK